MEPVTMTARTPLQQLMMEKALAMAEELELAGAAASDGHVLEELEILAVARGRDFTRGALEDALQRQVDEVEKKLRLAASADAVKGGITKERRRGRSYTSTGAVCLRRVYFDCRCCARGEYAADERLGIGGGQTRQARRLLCLAGTSWSFAASSAHLREFYGLEVAAGTIRNVCQAEAKHIERWQANVPQAADQFVKSSGEIEFFTDGTCVNTMQGWKEMRVGVFTKRRLGLAATPDQWAERKLPAVAARHVFAGIESADVFAARWPLVASRLGIRGSRRIDVVADGARWIWDRVSLYWPAAEGALDI